MPTSKEQSCVPYVSEAFSIDIFTVFSFVSIVVHDLSSIEVSKLEGPVLFAEPLAELNIVMDADQIVKQDNS